MEGRFFISKDGTQAWCDTVDYGPRPVVLAKNNGFIVAKFPGHTYASGQMRPFAPTKTYVFRIVKTEEWADSTCYTVVPVIGWSRKGTR